MRRECGPALEARRDTRPGGRVRGRFWPVPSEGRFGRVWVSWGRLSRRALGLVLLRRTRLASRGAGRPDGQWQNRGAPVRTYEICAEAQHLLQLPRAAEGDTSHAH